MKTQQTEETLELLTKNLFGEDRTRKPIVTKKEIHSVYRYKKEENIEERDYPITILEPIIHFNCPTCGRNFDPDLEFKDNASKKEFEISRMCQVCQDQTFGEDQ